VCGSFGVWLCGIGYGFKCGNGVQGSTGGEIQFVGAAPSTTIAILGTVIVLVAGQSRPIGTTFREGRLIAPSLIIGGWALHIVGAAGRCTGITRTITGWAVLRRVTFLTLHEAKDTVRGRPTQKIWTGLRQREDRGERESERCGGKSVEMHFERMLETDYCRDN